MDALAPGLLDIVPANPKTRGHPEKPARLLLLALVWVLAAVAAGIASLAVVAFVVGGVFVDVVKVVGRAVEEVS